MAGVANGLPERVQLAERARVVAGARTGAAVDLAELAAALLAVLAEVVARADALPEQPVARRVVLARTAAGEVADEQDQEAACERVSLQSSAAQCTGRK